MSHTNRSDEARWTPQPTGALRAIEAAARLESFTAAAEELSVTQSAVSHAIRDAERKLCVTLFRRDGRRVVLTEHGIRYVAHVREALRQLRAADDAVRDPDRRARILTVSVSPSFGAKWLAPRIGAFLARHPDLDLRVSAAARHVDFIDDDIDLAVRHGGGDWPALDVVRLCEEQLVAVCSPAFTKTHALKTPMDVMRAALIHHRDRSAWSRWSEVQGIAAPKGAARGLVVSEMSLAIDACLSGEGVALARTALAALDLNAGRLIRAPGEALPVDFAYWIVHPKNAPKSPALRQFKAWLLAEAEKDAGKSKTEKPACSVTP